MIIIKNKRCKPENILKKYPGAIICDVTSQATDDLRKLSPFFPHYGIPVPFSPGYTAACVEGIWQGLKVFEDSDVDISFYKSMKKDWNILKRSKITIYYNTIGKDYGVKKSNITLRKVVI